MIRSAPAAGRPAAARLLGTLVLTASLAACAASEPSLGGDAGGDADVLAEAADAPDGEAEASDDAAPETGCEGGLTLCGTECVDTRSSPEHCRYCSRACPDGLNADGVCVESECAVACREGWVDLDPTEGCEHPCTFVSPDESCNGADDDCDGVTDEGFPCVPGRAVACDPGCGTSGTGLCTLSCQFPTGASCTPPEETCNGIDDDCDTVCDDLYVCCRDTVGTCVTTCGTTGSRTCNALCAWGACTPPEEVCNGVDDDCLNGCDDGFDCCRGVPQACTTGCGSTGTRACDDACHLATACTPPAETCNGADDNCAGGCDEGCRHGVHRASAASGDHLYTLDASEPATLGYTMEYANYFHLYGAAVPGTVAFWRCRDINNGFHFYTASSTCEGAAHMVREGSMGFIGTSASPCAPIPLYRLVGFGGHFYTTSDAERATCITNGWGDEGIAGYVWTSG